MALRFRSVNDRYILVSVDQDSSASIASDGLPLTFVPVDGGRAHVSEWSVLLYPDFLSISPDRAEVLAGAGAGREIWGRKRVASIDQATAKFTFMTDAMSVAMSVAMSPAWSPDGSQIAFLSAPEVSSLVGGGEPARQALARRRIWVMSAGGKDKRQLTPDSNYRDEYPFWSRDGHYILFVRLDANDRSSIWSVNLESGALRRLAAIDADNPVNKLLEKMPEAKPTPTWFGYYGHIEWDRYFAWRED
jgi:hypothetical protein